MAALRHPNTLTMLGLCTVPPCLVCEYCPRGSLYDILKEGRGSPQAAAKLDWTRRLRMVRSPARVLLCM